MTVERRPAPGKRRLGARAARALAAVLAIAAAWATAHAVLDRPSVRARLRARVAEAVHARIADAQIGEVAVDWAFRASIGPVVVPGTRPGAPPLVRVERVRVRPSWAALLAGRAEPASVALHGVRIAPGGAADLRALLVHRPARIATPGAPAARAGTPVAVRFDDLVLALPLRGRTVELGPIDGVVRRAAADGDEVLAADLWLAGGGRVIFEARRGATGVRAHLHAGGLTREAFPAPLLEGPVSLDAGTLSIDVRADGPADLGRLSVRARAAAERLVLGGELLAPEPVGPMSLQAECDVDLDLAQRRAILRGGEIRLQHALRLSTHGEIRIGPGLPFSLGLRADDLDFGAAVAALPAALRPPAAAPQPRGPIAFRLEVQGPLPAPAEWAVDAALDLSRLREAARREAPGPLRTDFRWRPGDEGPEIAVGPRNPEFVPVAELPEHVIRAVTTSEDAGFFGHQGFDFDELRNAAVEGAEAGRLVRGGSTITQQLAKNLYLSREKTIARKIREAAITIGLEATLPKARLLEIYLNVVEWGPGIRGIGPAARHWFGKDARALTPKEAAFLASVIPNPIRYHVMFAKGEVPDFWEQRVDGILLKLSEQGVLTGDQLDEALREPIVFARG